jgi:membrane-associated phospholipid phosphatase
MKLKWISFFLILLYMSLPVLSKAQIRDTLVYKPKLKAFIIPTVFISYGLISLMGNNPIRDLDFTTKNELQEDHPLFAAHLDNYLQYAPAAAVYGLHLTGIKGKSSLIDATGTYALSLGIMGVTVNGLKKITHRERPDQSSLNSFPSGHTANAFAAAEFLNQEYKDISPWYGYAGYTVAAATGVLRIYNNRHWVSDVVAGAGFGILSTKVAYLVYPHLKRLVVGKGNANYSLVPSYQQHSLGFALNGTF